MAFRSFVALALLAGGDREPTREEQIELAREELNASLNALRAARAAWTAQHADVAAIRAALDEAERQLDAARVRLQRAISR